MKKIFAFFLILVLAPAFPSLFAQGFNSVNSPDGINVIAVGDSGRVFRSSNGGTTWASYVINSSVDFKSVISVDNDVWISASNGNVYKSFKIVSPVTAYATGFSGALKSVFFFNSLTGWTCGDSGKVFKTINGGLNWISSNSGIPNKKFNSISFSDLQNGAVAGDSGRIYLTTNGGSNWVLQTSLTSKNLLEVKYFTDGIFAAGEYGTLLKKSSGVWSSISSKILTDIRGISGTSMSNVRICGGGGFIRNNKNASTDFLNFELNPMMANLTDIHYYDSLTGFAVSSLNKAIIKTTNGGVSWFLTAGTTLSYSWVSKLTASSGIGNNLCMHPYDRNSMFVVYGSGVYVSRNRGDNWTQIATTTGGTKAHSFYVSPVDTNIWLCASESSTDAVIRSTNYGLTWTTIVAKNFSNYGQPLEMDQNNPSVFYFAPDNGGFYKSSDNGATFTDISGGFPFRSPCDLMVMHDSSNVIFLADGITGSGVGDIYKSSNGGINWVKVHTNSSSSEIPAMSNTQFDKSIAYATNWSGGQIYKTTNYGTNWSLLRTNPGSGWATDMCHEDPTFVMTGSYGSSTYISYDAGANFTTVTVGGGSGAGMIAPEKGYELNMQTGGLFKLNVNYSVLTDISINGTGGTVPEKFGLSQNYPNPFNPVTGIRYNIPVSGMVILKMFDIAGREVKSLVNENQNAGNYEVSVNASGLSSGVYFYRLISGNYVKTLKMIVTK